MVIEGGQRKSIWYDAEADEVCVIDQTRLPHEFAIHRLRTLEDACEAITSMRVRGAPLIGITAVFGVYLALRENPASLDAALRRLRATRPTAVNLRWALDRVAQELSEQTRADIVGGALDFALVLAEEDAVCCEAIGEHGGKVLRRLWRERCGQDRPLRVLTHCNAGALATVEWGTALAAIYKAAAAGVPLHVWVDETRPRNQGGALTCWELRRAGVDHSLIVDGAAGHVMVSGLVDVCVTGSDRVSASGDVCNKIGTYQVALAARDNNLPFYAALPVSTIDFDWPSADEAIPIEERAAEEISMATGIEVGGRETKVHQYPRETAVRNFAFDITPARLVTGIITEHGVFEANRASLVALANKTLAAAASTER
ncbi:MAG: S-methyl-5-thioribose-1-phosphate isomerase [Gammaproteobacteria bacterium]|nr:S-methyl-5-thioribose-1-phosphate isomerase [Gammaproteobacteria bacterium]MXY90502.1 S-methyl-5-thioribose-1-phosphate isomerase [Gammaproteobacteria bacterium]MYE99432.1 S-methyl-5-thioribose-1-phosphate isomerase [Gammaproteobacteria bacterium]MYG95889.1 S-methyl-5-thioribose-1-phosphate isomerase [Gammaproteobacteria bacterium]